MKKSIRSAAITIAMGATMVAIPSAAQASQADCDYVITQMNPLPILARIPNASQSVWVYRCEDLGGNTVGRFGSLSETDDNRSRVIQGTLSLNPKYSKKNLVGARAHEEGHGIYASFPNLKRQAFAKAMGLDYSTADYNLNPNEVYADSVARCHVGYVIAYRPTRPYVKDCNVLDAMSLGGPVPAKIAIIKNGATGWTLPNKATFKTTTGGPNQPAPPAQPPATSNPQVTSAPGNPLGGSVRPRP